MNTNFTQPNNQSNPDDGANNIPGTFAHTSDEQQITKENKQEDNEPEKSQPTKTAEVSPTPASSPAVTVADSKQNKVKKNKEQEYLAGWQRARADYQNLVKETEQRISDISKFATSELIHELLPIVDHFKYAFQGVPALERESNWLKGIRHIQNNFIKILENHGVEMIKTVGERFDPHLHEVVEEMETPGDEKDAAKNAPSSTIVAEVASGFKLHGKVIRCAKVKVIK